MEITESSDACLRFEAKRDTEAVWRADYDSISARRARQLVSPLLTLVTTRVPKARGV